MTTKRTKFTTRVLITFMVCCTMVATSIVISFAPVHRADAAVRHTIDPSRRYQEWHGWGSSLIWFATQLGGWTQEGETGAELREEIMELIFGDSGLRLNYGRYNVGGGGDPFSRFNGIGERGLPTVTHLRTGGDVQGWWRYCPVAHPSGHRNGRYYDGVMFRNILETNSDGNVYGPWQYIPWNERTREFYGGRDTIDANQRWVMEWINENVEDSWIEIFSNSPPYWMLESGCVSGNRAGTRQNLMADGINSVNRFRTGGGIQGNMQIDASLDYTRAFAQYMIDVANHLINVDGVRVNTIQPFNESSANWWAQNGIQEAAHFTHEGRSRVIEAMVDIFDEGNFSWADDVMIAGLDTQAATSAVNDLNNLTPRAREALGTLNWHLYYGRTNGNIANAVAAARQSDLRPFMSEWGWVGAGYPMEAAFAHTRAIVNHLNAGAEAYVLWQVIEELTTQLGMPSNYGPIKAAFFDSNDVPALASLGLCLGGYTIDIQYYFIGQYSRYIRPGYHILHTSHRNNHGIFQGTINNVENQIDLNLLDNHSTVAAISPCGEEMVLVIDNFRPHGHTFEFELLAGYTFDGGHITFSDSNGNHWTQRALNQSGNVVRVDVTPESVTTVVLRTTPGNADRIYIDENRQETWTGLPFAGAIPTSPYDLPVANRWFYPDAVRTNHGTRRGLANPQVNINNRNGHWNSPTNAASANMNIFMRFKGHGIELAAMLNDNQAASAVVDVWVNGVQIENGHVLHGPVNNTRRIFGTITGLDPDQYSLIRIQRRAQTEFRFDGGYIIMGIDPHPSELPVIEGVQGFGEELAVRFSAEDAHAAQRFAIEYRHESRLGWDTAVITATGVHNLSSGRYYYTQRLASYGNGGVYHVRMRNLISGIITQQEDVYVLAELSRDSRVMYNVALGDDIQTATVGVRQSRPSQDFGQDIFTEYEWGFVNTVGGGNALFRFEVGSGNVDIISISNNGNRIITQRNVEPSANMVEVTMPNNGTILVRQSSLSPIIVAMTHFDIGTQVAGDRDIALMPLVLDYENPSTNIAYAIMSDGSITQRTLAAGATEMYYHNFRGRLVSEYNGIIFETNVNFDSNNHFSRYLYRVNVGHNFGLAGTYADCGECAECDAGEPCESRIYTPSRPTFGGGGGAFYYSIGALQASAQYDRSGADGGWGYLDRNGTAGPGQGTNRVDNSGAWRSGGYTNRNMRYRFTNLPVGVTLGIRVGAHNLGWTNRTMRVYVNETDFTSAVINFPIPTMARGVHIGNLATNANPGTITGQFVVPKSGTVYVLARTNTPAGENPMLSFIEIFNLPEGAPALAETVNTPLISNINELRGMTRLNEVLELSNVIPSARIMVTADGRLINSSIAPAAEYPATTVEYNIDLAQFGLIGLRQGIVVYQRKEGSFTAPLSIPISLVPIVVTRIGTTWAERNVIRITPDPSIGTYVQDLVVTQPNGTQVDIAGNDFWHFRGYQRGIHHVRLVTLLGEVFYYSFDLAYVDEISFLADFTRDTWVTGVDVAINVSAPSGIARVTIDGVEVDTSGSYVVTVMENATIVVVVESAIGVIRTFSYIVTNVDNVMPSFSIEHGTAFAGGFRAVINNTQIGLSGITTELTFEGMNVAYDGAVFYAIQQGTYVIRHTSGTGLTYQRTLELRRGIGAMALATTSFDAGGQGLSVNALAGADVIVVNPFGQQVVATDGVFQLSNSGFYTVMVTLGSHMDVTLVEMTNVASRPIVQSTGCGSASVAATMVLLGLVVAGMAALLAKKKI